MQTDTIKLTIHVTQNKESIQARFDSGETNITAFSKEMNAPRGATERVLEACGITPCKKIVPPESPVSRIVINDILHALAELCDDAGKGLSAERLRAHIQETLF